ncbi:MAG: tRNA (adenosine(37)-N6)-dimethylallyltransferase MiaA [Desulfobacterales bacterium]|nr:tRNA (adenosine(37)-N6)-dimethylallyltransferase MiaA [Desulfobacterales bacterium]MCP4162573.1 tRNA (adenosine(37)-N6)-dimethylallyltransferase MiaA [Deltaproteobacteria bacterium]
MKTKKRIKIVVIYGPTGIGKTSTGINLARDLSGEIINADSMQIYKEMTIGTAKPDEAELAAIPHHLVDIVSPDESFDAALFAEAAGKKIEALSKRNILPIIVGGTAFYIKALLYGLFRENPANQETLEKIGLEYNEKGPNEMHNKLKSVDPVSAGKIHKNDSFRIIRALEVFQSTGKPISSFQKDHDFQDEKFDSLKICLTMDREKLYDRINRRVDIMIDSGLLEEVKGLIAKGYTKDLKSMRSIGYKHMTEFIEGVNDWEETVRLLKRDTRRYAKRQFTWLRKEKDVNWAEPSDYNRIKKITEEFLKS